MKLITSISGVRGIYGESLTENVVSKYSYSFSKIQSSGKILLAQDTRPHGSNLYKKILEILTSLGRDVISCGVIPTPTAQFIIKENKLAGGIVITASHNPIEWNGLKFLDSDGCFLNNEKINVLFSDSLFDNNTNINKNGIITNSTSLYKIHISNILSLSCVDIDKIKKCNFKVVVDTVNGAAYKVLPELLENLNCNVIKIHCDNNGIFPRGTEPIPSHLSDLSKEVCKHNADIGLATDPDADRLAVIDNNGLPIGEESTLILALEAYLKYYKDKQKVVTNLSTSMGVDYICTKYNSTVNRTSVGEINVVEKMKEINSEIGGEGNGGVILQESHLGRDSLVASVLILNHLANSKVKLNKILNKLPKYSMIKTKIDLKNNIDFNFIENYFSKKNKDITFINYDGLKIIWEDKWMHIRKSNTEPIIRIISEAKNIEISQSLIDSLYEAIN